MIDKLVFDGYRALCSQIARVAAERGERPIIEQVDAVLCEDGKSVMVEAYAADTGEAFMALLDGPAGPSFDEWAFGQAVLGEFELGHSI